MTGSVGDYEIMWRNSLRDREGCQGGFKWEGSVSYLIAVRAAFKTDSPFISISIRII